jgi:hypothetical protein
MEGTYALVGLMLMAFPVLVLWMWIRTKNIRTRFERRQSETERTLLDLQGEMAALHRSLKEVTDKFTVRDVSPSESKGGPASGAAAVPVGGVAPSAKEAGIVPAAPSIAPVPVFPQTDPRPVVGLVTPPAHSRASANIPIPTNRAAPPPTRPSVFDWLRAKLPLEEVLGMNLFAKIGIVLLVLGFALLGRVALVSMGPGGKVALLYAAAGTLLGGGIWLERKERYVLLGRTGIGGGWALTFFTTYAINHVQAMLVMGSETLNGVLLLGVAVCLAVHTLRYQSQLVTGLAFLLAFSTVALTQDTVYALSAGVILALGVVVVSLKMGWYELEVFGILASFGNHFYWLNKLHPSAMAGHVFPQFWPSTIILILYWGVFRISYVVRRVRTPRDERISTIAALANTMLLLGVMKYQSTRPHLAFYALLALGALEFGFGQLPVTRRRRPAFVLLTGVGTLLIFGSIPFKFSGNSIALLWMIAAETLILAGIVQAEGVFRRLGLLAGILTGFLVGFESRRLLDLRQHSDQPLIAIGVQLLTCSAIFYGNAHYIRERWRNLFGGLDGQLAQVQSYLGAAMALIGAWAIFPADATAVVWAVLMMGTALGARLLNDKPLNLQAWFFTAVVILRTAAVNCHFSDVYPHHSIARVVTLPLLSVAFYLTASILSGEDKLRRWLRTVTLLAGTSTMAGLAWLDVAPVWVTCAWLGLAVVMCIASRLLKVRDLCGHEHGLAAITIFGLLSWNVDARSAVARYVPLVLAAAAFYAMSRLCTWQDASYRRPAAWAHTWVATALLAGLAWHESAQPWLAVIWILFALALALVDRVWDVEELPWQTHTLAALAIYEAATVNLCVITRWHGIDLRLITLLVVVATLYALAYYARFPGAAREKTLKSLYSWAASAFGAWTLCSELQPIAVADGLAFLGLLLFEVGEWRKHRQLRLQGYVLLVLAFARIFFNNLTTATLPGAMISPRIYTVVPIAILNFFVWAQLQSGTKMDSLEREFIGNLLAWFGSGSIAALLYFQVGWEWIVLAWTILVLMLLAASLMLDKEIFLQQAMFLIVGVESGGIAHNIFGASHFIARGWRGNVVVLSLVSVLLLGGLPVAFKLRARYAESPLRFRLSRALGLNRPEQWLFFASVLLAALTIAVKMNAGILTLSWGVEGVMVILLGLAVSERSFRVTGLLLLLLCVCKIVVRDAWHLSERDRYITFIALGASLMLVSTLYNRYRESVRRLL